MKKNCISGTNPFFKSSKHHFQQKCKINQKRLTLNAKFTGYYIEMGGDHLSGTWKLESVTPQNHKYALNCDRND